MNIVCPNCNKIHILPGDKIPSTKVAANCKKCGMRMIISPEVVSLEEVPEVNAATSFENSDDEVLEEYRSEGSLQEHEEKTDRDEILVSNNGSKFLTSSENSFQGNGQDLYAVFPGLSNFSPEVFDLEHIFTADQEKGYGTSDNLLKFRIIRAVHELLTSIILYDSEKVLRIGKGTAYFPFEIPYANGIMTLLSNYFAIICTDRRMIFVNIDLKIEKPTRYVFQVPYEEIESLGRGIFRSSIIVRTRTGRNWNFTTVRRQHSKEIAGLINQIMVRTPTGAHDTISREQCCPNCYVPLPGGLTSCPHCAALFKKRDEALIRSLIMPGLGSIYLSYLPLGVMEITGYLATWLAALVLVILRVPGGIITAILLVMAYHGFVGYMAYKMAGKGYVLQNVAAKEVAVDQTDET